MTAKKYEIGGETYVQKKLVLGQLRQLMGVLKGVAIPAGAGALELLDMLGDKLPLALAVVLTPEGESPAGKDLPALARELEFSIDPDTALEAVTDFFDCNPIASTLEKLNTAMGSVMAKAETVIGSSRSASPSPEETSPSESESCGDTPSKK